MKWLKKVAATPLTNIAKVAATILDMFGDIIKSEHYQHETAEVEES